MAAQRVTREESQALTRGRLVEAAGEVFAEKGFYGASVEEVTERAGFTRGAFYSNFADKDELFLAVLDAHTQVQVDEVTSIISQAEEPEVVLAELRDWDARRPHDQTWLMLYTEFRLHALRNPAVRPRLAERERADRQAYARAVAATFKSVGLEPPAGSDELALILQSLSEGTGLAHAIDPEGVAPSAFFDSLELLFRATVALAAQTGAKTSEGAKRSAGAPGRSRHRGRRQPSRDR
jgi:AcrR family transcriptional regulator